MQTLKTWCVVSLVGGFGLVGACGDDSKGDDGSGGSAAEGGTKGGAAGQSGADGNNAGMSGDGGTGGAAFACPSDLRSAPGKACPEDGETCIDPAASCEHNWSVQCVDGRWERLPGAFAPCAGAGGQSGEGSDGGGATRGGANGAS